MDINTIIENINEKLGDNKDLITDNIAELIQYENNMVTQNKEKEEEINSLKSRNETLTNVNANLLKSVPVVKEEIIEKETEEVKPFSFKSCFDKKGNFIK